MHCEESSTDTYSQKEKNISLNTQWYKVKEMVKERERVNYFSHRTHEHLWSLIASYIRGLD